MDNGTDLSLWDLNPGVGDRIRLLPVLLNKQGNILKI
jgi:hypothetical protein